MKHKGTVTIETERLILRRFTIEDTEACFRNWAGDPKVTEFLRWQTHESIEVTKSVLSDWVTGYENPSFYQWAIVPKSIGEPIGTISVVDRNENANTVHIGYCIGSRFWNNGYTSEAFAAIIPFFFREVGVGRIESQHDPSNPASGAVMRKCGLRLEGTHRKSDWSNRGIVDASVYALLAEEYRNP